MKAGDRVIYVGETFKTYDSIPVNKGDIFTVTAIDEYVARLVNYNTPREVSFNTWEIILATELNKLLYS